MTGITKQFKKNTHTQKRQERKKKRKERKTKSALPQASLANNRVKNDREEYIELSFPCFAFLRGSVYNESENIMSLRNTTVLDT